VSAGQYPAPVGGADPEGRSLAARIVGLLGERQQTVAVAESLTGGLLGAAITTVPGASVVFRGGVIAYATDLKTRLLGVPQALLAARGAVDPEVAGAMAEGVRERLGAAVGMATTGVAGPDPADGKPPGTVHIAVSSARGKATRTLALAGTRDEVRRQTVEESLRLLWSVLWEESP
jgi:nicotinamide-nucleotide amidase